MKRLLTLTLGAVALLGVIALSAFAGGAFVYAALQGALPLQAAPPLQTDGNERGVLVASVRPDSPAAKAGLRRGDIVLEVNGQTTDTALAVRQALAEVADGEAVALQVLRGDERLSLAASLDGARTLGLTTCGDFESFHEFSGPLAEPFIPSSGALITEVVPNSPAAGADLKAGDHILKMDGQDLTPENNLRELITARQPGDAVTLTVRSAGEEPRDVTVTLGENPEEAGQAYLGVRYFDGGGAAFARPFVGELPFAPESFFTLPEGVARGVFIGQVEADSPAAKAGLKTGDVVTAINGEAVSGPRALAEAVAARGPGEVLKLDVRRGDETLTLDVTLGERPNEPGEAYLGVSVAGYFFKSEIAPDGPRPFLPEHPFLPELNFGDDV